MCLQSTHPAGRAETRSDGDGSKSSHTLEDPVVLYVVHQVVYRTHVRLDGDGRARVTVGRHAH